MSQYLLGLNEEEKENILNKHKSVYNGYSIKQNVSNLQPLYVQDFANDKEGITVNNKGEVTTYKNMSINESEDNEQYEKVDYLGTDVEMEEGIMDFFSKKKNTVKKPYTAEAVKFIISSINDSKTEEQLETAMRMANNLFKSNDDVNDAYKQRIDIAYKRKSDELGNYLTKDKINNIMNDIESDSEFNEDIEPLQESVLDILKWFKKIK